jgi:hypothetical protein
MKRKLLWGAIAFLVLCSLAAVMVHFRRQAAQRRAEANRVVIEAALRRFSEMVPLGATRTQVKETLQTQGVAFRERCCFEPNAPFSILVQVGQEDKPWFCSEWLDYIAFEFSFFDAPPSAIDILGSDGLRLIHLTSNGEGCL